MAKLERLINMDCMLSLILQKEKDTEKKFSIMKTEKLKVKFINLMTIIMGKELSIMKMKINNQKFILKMAKKKENNSNTLKMEKLNMKLIMLMAIIMGKEL